VSESVLGEALKDQEGFAERNPKAV